MNNLVISSVLGELIEKHFLLATRGGKDCRLLVPGLTRKIAKQIHHYLQKQGIKSYFVIGSDGADEPSEKDHFITAEGLTSKRIGSFVAVVTPGKLVYIQDSVRGSGGAIRSLSFSEEWPWIDHGIESLRFNGPVLDLLVQRWSSDKAKQDWLREFTLELLENTGSSSSRVHIFLEEIVGAFNSNLYPDVSGIREKFLCHSGVPYPRGHLLPVKQLVKDTNELCRKIVTRCRREDGLRKQLEERVIEVVEGIERQNEVKISLAHFLDGIGMSTTHDLGVLEFYKCWGPDKDDTSHWKKLDTKLLARLFDINDHDKGSLSYEIECERGITDGDNKKLATFLDENIKLKITYDIEQREFVEGDWSIQVLNRQHVVSQCKLAEPTGHVYLELNTTNLVTNNYLRKLPIRIALTLGDDVEVYKRLDVHLCGEERPAFTVVDQPFEVFDATPELPESEEVFDKKLTVDRPVHLFLFSHEINNKVVLYDEDEKEIGLVDKMKGIKRSAQPVDAGIEPGGLVTRKCKFGELMSVLCLEADDIEKGEFTLEDELRRTISSGERNRLIELTKLFQGVKDKPYSALGQINDASRRRIFLASILTSRKGWRPVVLANLLSTSSKMVARPIGKFINCVGPIEDDEFQTLTLPLEALNLLKKYSDARDTVLEEVNSFFAPGEHPIYASHPIYVHERSDQIEDILSNYLKAYLNILAYLEDNKGKLEWSQLFVLVHIDCIIHWDNSRLRNTFFLVGPWHPLVLARRFMVQAALFARAERLLHNSNGEHFRNLCSLLGNVQGFRWVLGMSGDDRIVEPAYSMLTSDPGWHFAMTVKVFELVALEEIDGLQGIAQRLRLNLGLKIASENSDNNVLVTTCLSKYLQAFPSRRSIGIRIRGGYVGSDIVKTVDRNIHGDGEPTEQGQQLPGGVRLYFQEPLGNEINVRWTDPPLYAYQYEKDEDCFLEAHPDIYMLPPVSDISFTSDVLTRQNTPRGNAREAVFSKQLFWLAEGNTRVPKSISLEHGGPSNAPDDIGGKFAKAMRIISVILGNPVATVCEVDLPQKLSVPWVVISGYSIDPAILVKYVKDGADRKIQDRALWDYKLDVTGQGSSYFVLSTIPRGFEIAVNGFFGRKDFASDFIVKLGRVGIAIGGEALKSGRHALGVIGLIGAVEMLIGETGDGKSPISSSSSTVGFLIPVDSFSSFFGKSSSRERKRTDLLAVRLVLPNSESRKLCISACGVESKFVSGTFQIIDVPKALEQAGETCNEFKKLVVTSLCQGAMPERMALLNILTFGLRIASPSNRDEIEKWVEKEKIIYDLILAGDYEYLDLKYEGLLFSTESKLQGVAEHKPIGKGLWVRLTKSHWPEICETSQINNIRHALCELFDAPESSSLPSGLRPKVSLPTSRVPSEEELLEPYKTPIPKQPSPEYILRDPTGSNETEPTEKQGKLPLKGIFIGVDNSRRKAYFDPQSSVDPLDNLNVMVTGSSGKGKTQFLKYLIYKLREQDKNVLVLDMKNDFASDKKFCEKAKLERIFVSFDGLPLNPLIPYPIQHPDTEELVIQSGQYIAGVSSVLRKVYRLGVQQQVALKNAIVEAFTEAGIPATGTVPFAQDFHFPDFADVGDSLQNVNPTAYNRLDPLFTLGLFRPEFRNQSFHGLVNRAVVLDLSRIPSDEIKNTLAQLIVLSCHSYYNSQPHSGIIRQFLVFDEGHRVLDSDYMSNLVRECRAYGVGTILSSQYPSDFPGEISASMATKIVHGNDKDTEQVKNIVQLLGCEGREEEIASMERFQAFMDNRHHQHTNLRTMNYPLFLVWTKLKELDGCATRYELSQAEGLDISKLPIGTLVHQLELLGLGEEREGHVLLMERN